MKIKPSSDLIEQAIIKYPFGLRVGRGRKVVAVASIQEAQLAWERYRDERCLGASESPRVTVVDLNSGKTVAHISYNGRAWRTDPRKLGAKLEEILPIDGPSPPQYQ
jgi:hypothetical protein